MENTMKQATVDRIVALNNKIFDMERTVDNLEHAVSSQRYYLAADKTADRVLELRGAMENLNTARRRLEALRRELDGEMLTIFNENNWN